MAARNYTRDCITATFILATAPLWSLVRLLGHDETGTSVFITCGQLLSLIPGSIGAFARRAFYLMTLEDCARDVGVGFGTWFSKRKVQVGPRVSIGANCTIGSCTIGAGSLLGSNIDVLSGRHHHVREGEQTQIADAMATFSQIRLGANIWIGNRVLVMADVGDNAVVGAGSVVVRDIPADSLAVGNPAVIKQRTVCR